MSPPLRTGFFLLLLLSSMAALGEAQGISLARLAVDRDLSLERAVQAANERLRLQDWVAQREQLAEARAQLGSALLGDAPSVGGIWRDYDWIEDRDIYEAEIYLALPLWRPGERKALRALAEEDAGLARLQGQSRSLATAARVRTALWQWQEADSEVALVEQLLAGAQRYAEQVQTRFEAGDVARTEYLQARQQVLDLRSRLLDAQAQLIDSSRLWRLVTGLDAIPANTVETRSTVDRIDERHPLLRLGIAELNVLKADVEVSRNSGSMRPSVSINMKRELFEEALPPLDSVGIGIDIPLGRGRQNAVYLSEKAQRVLEAEVELQNLRRRLEEELHEVRHQIHINDNNLQGSRELLDIARQVYQMQQLANEQGEIAVIEVLRAGQALAMAKSRATSLALQRNALVARYNQVVGVMPQ